MMTFARLQHRRLIAIWLTSVLFLVACGCLTNIPEGLPPTALAAGFSLLVLVTLIPVLLAFVLIWLLPVLRGIVDLLVAVGLVMPLLEISANALGLQETWREVVVLGSAFLALFFCFGGGGLGRRFWFAYRSTGNVVVPGTPEDIWPYLVVSDAKQKQHFMPNLLSLRVNPTDQSRMQARYAMSRGSTLTMDLTNVQETWPVSVSFDHIGDSPLLNGALCTGSFQLELTPLTSSTTALRIRIATGPLPPSVVFTLWLDNMAQDEAQMALEAITGKGNHSLYRRAMLGFMKTYQARNPS